MSEAVQYLTKEVVKNLDNWYLEITYSNSKETKTEKLELNKSL